MEREDYDAFSAFLREINLDIGYAPRIIANDFDQRGLRLFIMSVSGDNILIEPSPVHHVTDPNLLNHQSGATQGCLA